MMVFNTVAIQLLHTILAEQAEWESRCFIKTKQNVSMNLSDDRVQHCTTQIIHSEMISKPIQAASMTVADISVSVLVQDQNLFSEITDLKQMWVNAEAEDELYNELCQTICKKQRSFSTVLKVRVFIMKCFLSDEEKLLFCKRHWVLFSEPLCTNWFSIHMTQQWLNTQKKCNWCSLSQQFFWPEMLQNVCTFCWIVTNAVWTTAEKTADKASWSLTCIEADLTKDIHWLCSRSTVKWGLYEPSDNYRLS
jgi:hypothetical protein